MEITLLCNDCGEPFTIRGPGELPQICATCAQAFTWPVLARLGGDA